MNWDLVVDIADTITAISAVVAVVVATVLGLKAIRVAKAGNDVADAAYETAERELRYTQIDHVLQDALALASASEGLVPSSGSDPEPGRSVLRDRFEAFESRLRVVKGLALTSDEAEIDRVQGFASALNAFALAREFLAREGYGVLAETVTSGDYTAEIVEDLARGVGGVAVDMRESLYAESEYANEIDYRVVPGVYQPGARATEKLRARLAEPEWKPEKAESIRLLATWARVVLGRAEVREDVDGPVLVDTAWDLRFVDGVKVGNEDDCEPGDHADSQPGGRDYDRPGGKADIHPPDEVVSRAQRIDESINGFVKSAGAVHFLVEDEDGVPDYVPVMATPEEIATEFLGFLRGEFVNETVKLVNNLRFTGTPS